MRYMPTPTTGLDQMYIDQPSHLTCHSLLVGNSSSHVARNVTLVEHRRSASAMEVLDWLVMKRDTR